METLVEQPPIVEQFDQYRRQYNDAATWLAETLDGSMRTPFEYTSDGQELYAEDGGMLGTIFEASVLDAQRLVSENPRLGFELRRRSIEAEEYADMLAMMRDEAPNTMVVTSDFPAELMSATQDVGGYNVVRKQTMLRVIIKQGQTLKMYSQTLDGSDRQALVAIHRYLGHEPNPGELLGQRVQIDLDDQDQRHLTDRLTSVYDHSLQRRRGGIWQAGRQEVAQDTYSFVLSQHRLIDHFVRKGLVDSADNDDRYNLAALLAKRFDDFKNPALVFDVTPEAIIFDRLRHPIEQELQQAGSEARVAGKVFSGCGASAGPNGLSATEQLDALGFGNTSKGSDEDDYGPLSFKCKNGHTNRRPRGKLINNCRVASCKNSVAC